MESSDVTRAAVMEHLAAFNAHDTARLLRGLDDQVVWATGRDVIEGLAAVADIFDEWLWAIRPRLDLVRLVVDDDAAAAELVEHLIVDGQLMQFPIAVFFSVRVGLLTRVKVFREGSADLAETAR